MEDTKSKAPVVALYLRVSTSQQDFEIQLDGLREEAQRMGAKIYNEYTDKGFGGDTQASDRQYADDVIRDAGLGKFQTLLVWKIDRIARDEEYGLTYLRQIEKTGCKIRFINEPNLNTPEQYTEQAASSIKSMRVMYLMGARMMLESIRTNVRASKKSWIKANKWPSSQIPDGYKLNSNYGLDKDETRAPTIERIFDLYVDGKLTVRQIVDLLNKEGTPSATARKADKKWVKDSVQDKLSNQVYIGKLPIQWKDKINNTAVVIHTFTCPPIISDERFKEVQEIKEERIKRSRGNHRREYPFRPYVYCANCGYALHAWASGSGTGHVSSHYGSRRPYGDEPKYTRRCANGCGKISERNLIRGVYKHVGEFLLFPMRRDRMKQPSLDKLLEFLEGGDTSDINKKREAELAQLTKEIIKLREAPEKIKYMFEHDHINEREFEARMAKVNANPRIKMVEERVRFIQQTLVGEEEQKRRIDSLAIWAKEVMARLEERKAPPVPKNAERKTMGVYTATYEQQKEFVLQLLKFIKKIHVDVPNKKLTIQTRIPKYLDGKVVFESDPVIVRGRPRKPNGDNGGNNGGNNSLKQVTSVNSSNQYSRIYYKNPLLSNFPIKNGVFAF